MENIENKNNNPSVTQINDTNSPAESNNKKESIEHYTVLTLRGLVMFPKSIIHFDVGRRKTKIALMKAINQDQRVFITTQKTLDFSDPTPNDIFDIGVIASIKQIIRLRDGLVRVVAEGLDRAKIVSAIDNDECLEADVKRIYTKEPVDSPETKALLRTAKYFFEEYAKKSTKIPQDIIMMVKDAISCGEIADNIADIVIKDVSKKQEVLSTINSVKRLEKVMDFLVEETQILSIEERIHSRVRERIDENQKEYYLREQLRAIQEELGDTDDILRDIDDYKEKIFSLRTTDENKNKLLKECDKLLKMPPGSHEGSVIRSYIDACLELPWGIYTKDSINLEKVRKVIDKDHYGMEKVKESIIEQLAVKYLNNDINGQIICLVGPPGVGKTSIAKSIANSIGRKYVRIALGGVHDEAEIRGHRRTYIGAMPGRIISAIKQAGSSNPLILLDEIDKLGKDFKGDPTSALLEVLDSEQNNSFVDHYIDMPFDLSKVMFITTANDYSMIPTPLADRMDIIHLSSYTREEKFNIAKKHLLTKQLEKNGLTSKLFKISDNAMYDIIDSYTREAGVRTLERTISKVMKKAAVTIISNGMKKVIVKQPELEKYLGPKKFKNDTLSEIDEIGVVTGLAWTSVGGETMPIEVALLEGNGKIELTGSLGDVMKESAKIAISSIRARAKDLNIDSDFYKKYDIHIHAPEGAVPKDGPSAGVTMTTALVSALLNIPVNRSVAMTGEITLRGKVLPIGGLKEKTMAAYRLGIKKIIIPKDNQSDLEEVDKVVKDSIEFVFADNIDTVLRSALLLDKEV